MFKIAAVLTLFLALAPALASPTARQSTCFPTFDGRSVSITFGGSEWNVNSLQTGSLISMHNPATLNAGEWRIESTGVGQGVYVIKANNVPANNLVVGQQVHSDNLILSPIGLTTLGFRIACSACTPPWSLPAGGVVGQGCTIIRQGNEHCATVFFNGPGHSPGEMKLQQCGVSAQEFSFSIV
ncbi:hypothetical protein C8J57DRAFT_1471684 [Mycena rebaudengoi]|nr:hypothetical protein C8J57DRAFT_1471684 [Mycena rebaudengoi]